MSSQFKMSLKKTFVEVGYFYTWVWTLENWYPEKPGPWKAWNKYGIENLSYSRAYQENCPLWKCSSMNIPPYESSPLWKLPPSPPSESCPQENSPYENPIPLGKLPPMKSPMKAVQHSIFIKTTKVLFDTQKISQKILGLDTFFTEWKNSKSPRKAKIAKLHLLASCTSQGELKLGKTKTIKFGKYVKLLNSQWSLYITFWNF